MLPHEKELLYGVKPEDCQITPWALKEFNIKKHWSCSRGEGIKVAVIDTGCDLDHIDIKSNLLEGYDFVNKHKYPDDDNGHGTHVAGTIAACDNSLGMVGIAPEAKIIPIKCLDKDGGGSTRLISDGIDFAIKAGADIITMSLGSKGASLDILRSVRRANKAGVIMCCAAGNSGNSHDLLFPANFDETISIGSISRRLKVSRFKMIEIRCLHYNWLADVWKKYHKPTKKIKRVFDTDSIPELFSDFSGFLELEPRRTVAGFPADRAHLSHWHFIGCGSCLVVCVHVRLAAGNRQR